MSWRNYDFGYYPPAKPIEVADGIKAKSRRGNIGETWWSGRWIEVLESFHMGARLGRGRSYARRGQVLNIEIEPGQVTAGVQGTRPTPYEVEINLAPLSDKDWEKVTDAMASQAIFAAKLLAGEMPKNIEEAFQSAKVSLFPEKRRDLETDCSCPDWANPCKHIAAVYFLLAEEFDRDPFMIFKLRGRSKEEIIEALRAKRSESAGPPARGNSPIIERAEEITPLDECMENFWSCGEQLGDVQPNLKAPDVECAVLKRLGDSPFVVGKDNVSRILEPLYRDVSSRALEKALGGETEKGN